MKLEKEALKRLFVLQLEFAYQSQSHPTATLAPAVIATVEVNVTSVMARVAAVDLETTTETMLTVTLVIAVVLAYVTINVTSVKTMVLVTVMVALALLVVDLVLPIAIPVAVLIATVKVSVTNALITMHGEILLDPMVHLVLLSTMVEMVESLREYHCH